MQQNLRILMHFVEWFILGPDERSEPQRGATRPRHDVRALASLLVELYETGLAGFLGILCAYRSGCKTLTTSETRTDYKISECPCHSRPPKWSVQPRKCERHDRIDHNWWGIYVSGGPKKKHVVFDALKSPLCVIEVHDAFLARWKHHEICCLKVSFTRDPALLQCLPLDAVEYSARHVERVIVSCSRHVEDVLLSYITSLESLLRRTRHFFLGDPVYGISNWIFAKRFISLRG